MAVAPPLPVSTWPTYLLKRIPENARSQLSSEAQQRNVSIQDVIRSILCNRYRLVCPQTSFRYEPARDGGVSATIHLRLQRKLKRALDREAEQSGRSLRDIILTAIDSHYA